MTPISRGLTYPDGFRVGSARAGLKTEGDDLELVACDSEAAFAGVFTTNVVKASCVSWSQTVARAGRCRAILCNAGNANACNGSQGDRDTRRMAELAAGCLGAFPEQVAIASTGIIGHPMPMEKLETGIPLAFRALGAGETADLRAARAIMTTDLVPKLAAVEASSDRWKGTLRIGGMCKGSGMIAPNMATMLCFLTTDAKVEPAHLQAALAAATRRTFNRMTVDGDTSTNDMVLLMASGRSATVGEEALGAFTEALESVCMTLAKAVARDGEGATKLVEVHVRGAASEADAERIARTVAESPLVKTALFGADPNWGRILMAAGRAGVAFDPGRVTVSLGPQVVFRGGMGAAFDPAEASDYLKGGEVRIEVSLGEGSGEASVWTCDFSYDYVRINAEYHT